MFSSSFVNTSNNVPTHRTPAPTAQPIQTQFGKSSRIKDLIDEVSMFVKNNKYTLLFSGAAIVAAYQAPITFIVFSFAGLSLKFIYDRAISPKMEPVKRALPFFQP